MKKDNSWPKELKAMVAVVLTTLVVVLGGWGWQKWRSEQSLAGYLASIPDYSYVAAKLGEKSVKLEVVNTTASIQQGLSDREAIGSDGMLFVMPARGFYPFWMPRMHFDLDIVWLDDSIIVDITPNVPAQPGVALTNLPLYTSSQPANLVVELPAGQAAAWSLQPGDQLEIIRE